MLALLHAGATGPKGLHHFERKAVRLIQSHGGRILSAFNPRGHERSEIPDEVHLIEFPSDSAFQAYREDPALIALSAEREAAISATTVYVSEQLIPYQGQE